MSETRRLPVEPPASPSIQRELAEALVHAGLSAIPVVGGAAVEALARTQPPSAKLLTFSATAA